MCIAALSDFTPNERRAIALVEMLRMQRVVAQTLSSLVAVEADPYAEAAASTLDQKELSTC